MCESKTFTTPKQWDYTLCIFRNSKYSTIAGMVSQIKKTIGTRDLGINLNSKKEEELFKWFLACLLFGKPIQQEIARAAYFEFVKEGLTTPQKILDAGWDEIVKILDRAHYVRYDFSTATKLLNISKMLLNRYGGIGELIKQSVSGKDLRAKLQEFKGVGPITARIFLGEIKPLYSL